MHSLALAWFMKSDPESEMVLNKTCRVGAIESTHEAASDRMDAGRGLSTSASSPYAAGTPSRESHRASQNRLREEPDLSVLAVF